MANVISKAMELKKNQLYKITFGSNHPDLKGVRYSNNKKFPRPNYQNPTIDLSNGRSNIVILVTNPEYKNLLRKPYFGDPEDLNNPLRIVEFIYNGQVYYSSNVEELLDPSLNKIEEV